MMLIALVGFAIYSDDPRFFMADGGIDRAMAEEIILRIGYEQLPTIVGALLLAAGAAIIISTGNTFLMVTSTNVTRDIYQAFAKDRQAGDFGGTVSMPHSADRVDVGSGSVDVPRADEAGERGLIRAQRWAIVGIGILAYLMMSQFETILEMALVSYTMIGASLAPALLAAFFWKRVTRIAGVASIASGMLTVIVITVLNSIFRDAAGPVEMLGIPLPIDTDYIALPAVFVSVTTLVAVSILTERPAVGDWEQFIDATNE
jgi:SSS family solute:Na+ symporter